MIDPGLKLHSAKCLENRVHLGEVASRWSAVAERVLGWQRVVKGRPAHVAGVHTVLADVKLLTQTELQIVRTACELERTNAQKKPCKAQFPIKDLFIIYVLFVYSQC